MNTTEFFAPIKTASVEAEQKPAKTGEVAEIRGLSAVELLHIGGGTGHVSIV
jgi:hypothetical protein